MRPTISDPKMVNKVIEEITTYIAANLAYISEAYGQAVTVIREVDARPKRIPAVGTSNNYIEMFPDGSVKNLLFGVAHDPAEVVSQTYEVTRYKQRVSLIFWIDQRQFNAALTHLATDEIISDVLSTIKASGKQMQLIEIYKEPDNVYAGFDYEIVRAQFLMFPYTGFRLVYQVKYNDPC